MERAIEPSLKRRSRFFWEQTMHRVMRLIVLSGCILGCVFPGCGRDDPPAILEFRPPIEKTIEEDEPEVVEKVPEAAPEPEKKPEPKPKPKPEPKPKPKPKSKPKKVEAPPPPPEPEPEAPADASIIGTWRVKKITEHGHTQELPEGMKMIFTFTEDGTVKMTVSHERMPEPHTEEGSYSISDGQITLDIQGESKTGTYEFEGNDKLTIKIADEAEMVMVRQ